MSNVIKFLIKFLQGFFMFNTIFNQYPQKNHNANEILSHKEWVDYKPQKQAKKTNPF